MGDKKFTLFEFHSHGETQFGPKVMGSNPEEAKEEAEEALEGIEDLGDGDLGGGVPVGRILLGLALGFGIYLLVSKLLGGDEDVEVEESEEDYGEEVAV